ncbi:General transcription factor II-I repeat domain-containing protein 2B [Thelohanellus kitauei]|uniref:General transcription factor II-I repeat domain-containing protein 2B n=1 Tax=Thelohanellus kitauei TaxID=669202 RepID=A0A0C2MFT7_THEKT|nr:General transcription factor II-I repeat domain-containing protein 2B [Thelohanellus kitauei]
MKQLNIKLQGNAIFASEIYLTLKAFKVKLKLFSCRLIQSIKTHISTLEFVAHQITSTDKYTNMISALDNEFTRFLTDFQKLRAEFDILSLHFKSDFEKAPDVLQLELIDLQWDSVLKEKFHLKSLKNVMRHSMSMFINMRKMAMKLLVLFGSTYIYEQTVSTINIKKTKIHSN